MKLHHREIKESLSEYARGSLDEEIKGKIGEHLGSCEDCRSELTLLRELLEMETPDPGELFWQSLPGQVRGAVEQARTTRFSLKSMLLKRLPIAAAIAILFFLAVKLQQKGGISDLDLYFNDTSTTVTALFWDYNDLTEKDIPLNINVAALTEANGYTDNFVEFSYYGDLSTLSSSELDGLYEDLSKGHNLGG